MAVVNQKNTDTDTTVPGIRNVKRVSAGEGLLQNPNGKKSQTTANVQRVFRSANDNNPRRIQTGASPKKAVQVGLEAMQLVKGWRLLWTAILSTTPVYIVQLVFALICLLGFILLGGIDASSVLSAADIAAFGTGSNVGGSILFIGMAVCFICGFVTFLMSASFYAFSGLDTMVGFSVLILVLCSVALLCPILNLLPWMWLWCLYGAFYGVRP